MAGASVRFAPQCRQTRCGAKLDLGPTSGPCFRESPLATQDLGAGTEETHSVIPARRDRQAVRDRAVAAAELHSDRTVAAFFRGDVVQSVGAELVLLEEPLGVVDGDRPEAVDGHVPDT